MSVMPDLGTPYDLVCEQRDLTGASNSQDPRYLQLRRGDVTLNVGGPFTYLKMLHGWATEKGLPDREAHKRLKDARKDRDVVKIQAEDGVQYKYLTKLIDLATGNDLKQITLTPTGQ